MYSKRPSALILTALSSVVFLACALQETETDQPQAAVESAAIQERVAAIRGLEFTHNVRTLLENRRALAQRLKGELIARHGGPAELEKRAAAYRKLGLLTASEDLKKALVETLADKTAGFYSLRAKLIVLAKPTGILYSNGLGESGNGVPETIIAHELTHALQDQHFQLTQRLLESSNGDRAIALRAVTEGDAILTELAYGSARQNEPTDTEPAIGEIIAATKPLVASLPALLAERVLFPYESGTTFIHRVYRQYGWAGVNLLYRYPPLSTEQILHPEKFFNNDVPVEVTFNGLEALFPTGWKPLENNVLGELLVRCLFKTYLPLVGAAGEASGWGGDRFAAFQRDGTTAFLWLTTWDTETDAEKFRRNYLKVLEMKYGENKSASPSTFLKRRTRSVMIVEGIDIVRALPAIETIWQKAKLVKASSKNPFSLRDPALISSHRKSHNFLGTEPAPGVEE